MVWAEDDPPMVELLILFAHTSGLTAAGKPFVFESGRSPDLR
jgi:hypothetical protein